MNKNKMHSSGRERKERRKRKDRRSKVVCMSGLVHIKY